MVRAALLLPVMLVFALLPEPWKGMLATHGPAHVFVHVAAFCGAFLFIVSRGASLRTALFWAALLFAFGAALEIFQTWAYRTLLEYDDIAANGAGVIVGLFLRQARFEARASE